MFFLSLLLPIISTWRYPTRKLLLLWTLYTNELICLKLIIICQLLYFPTYVHNCIELNWIDQRNDLLLPSLFFRRWAFPPQNIYRTKDFLLWVDLNFLSIIVRDITGADAHFGNSKPIGNRRWEIIDRQVDYLWKIGPPIHVPNFSPWLCCN